MKSTRKYVFGYLFVKFAKLLAILTTIATTVYIAIVTGGYRVANRAAAYEQDAGLKLTLDRLGEEVDFAIKEVGRIAPVSDLKALPKSTIPSRLSEFEAVAKALDGAEAQRIELKKRLMFSVDAGIKALQTKIGETVREIEKVRQTMDVPPASNQDPQPDNKPTTGQVAARSALDMPARSIFGTGVSNTLRTAHNSLSDAEGFFTKLAESAEKEENKKLIKSVLDDLTKLKGWLPALPEPKPAEQLNVQPLQQPLREAQVQSPELDPLETAVRTHRALAQALQEIHDTVTQNWTLDRSIVEAVGVMQRERDQCRAAEATQDVLRTAWITKTFLTILAGVAIAFMILVFADFIQSFFDTASSAREILGHLKDRED
ncbi:MAG: hypothetical protein JNJ83_22555 [Verrucomicrobiaceae bacterium]|nr:hypothetical protein [Verrucomicrobiaceae bacterium]